MAYALCDLFPPQFEDANGNPLVLGTVEFYIWNTTTPTPFYTDSIGTSGGTSCALGLIGQPINGGGASIQIFLDTSIVYKVVRKDATGVAIAPTIGPFYPGAGLGSGDAALGDALMVVHRTFAGAVATTQHAMNEALDIDPVADIGAAGDGVTDDTAKINTALAVGRWVDGKDRIFAVSGDIALPAITKMRNIKFKQLSPNASARRTLYMSTGTLCHLQNVSVDRNGDGAGGSLADAAGIWINDCDRVILEDAEVFGDDKGTGVVVVDCDDARLDRVNVHDIKYGTSADSAYTDDQVQGIWLIRGNRASVNAPVVKNLSGEWSGQPEFPRFTRGLVVSGTKDFTIIGHTINSVDQGMDISGDANGARFNVLGGVVTNAYTWGYKCANSIQHGVFVGCVADKCSLGSFVTSAPNSVSTYQTQNIDFIGCIAYATGELGVWNASLNVASFRNQNTPAYTTWPRSIRYLQCQSYGGSNTEYGYLNDAIIGGNGDQWVEQIDCTSISVSVAHFSGLHEGYLYRGRTNAQSIPNNAYTAIVWDTVNEDRMLANGATGDEILMRRAGVYTFRSVAGFAANGTGIRGIRITKNGTEIPGSKDSRPTFAGGVIHCSTGVDVRCNIGDIIRVEVLQDSGGALNLQAGESFVRVTQNKLGVGT
jgi:hypothetical protein